LERSSQPLDGKPLFPTFFLGGFECSTHRRHDRARLDMIAATGHDTWASQDYHALQAQGISAARDGIRWHLIENAAGHFDWSSVRRQVAAARETGTQVIWDLSHYGWPDHLDIFSPEYLLSFAKLAAGFARLLKEELPGPHFISPVNEISFFSWAGGEVGYFNPFKHGRGEELKRQLVRSALAAMDAIWEVLPDARFVHCDPMIHVQPRTSDPAEVKAAAAHTSSQYAAWEMIAGRQAPELGGAEKYLDILGVNYYVHNQWFFPGGHGTLIEPSHPQHKRVRELLEELYSRLQRPILIAETGIENENRSSWLRYMADEVAAALGAGIPIEGICLYPICNHPGWDRGRHCHNGLFDYPDDAGEREVFAPLAQEIQRQALRFERLRAGDPEQEIDAKSSGCENLSELDAVARDMEAKSEDDRQQGLFSN
jgi:beta-glucosidase/6-phospho-beta-glucosidase/beta-galactosidase